MYFCTSVYFKTSKKKTPIDPDNISEEIFLNFKLAVGKFVLNFRLTYWVKTFLEPLSILTKYKTSVTPKIANIFIFIYVSTIFQSSSG
jgi:hypothetical protein